MLDNGSLRSTPVTHLAPTERTRVAPSRPGSGSRFDAVLTHRAVRLVVVISMLVAFSASIMATAVPAAAATPALWTQLSPATSQTARSGASIAYDPGTGQTIAFGGNANGTAQGDTWTWSGSTWTQLSPATSPAARYGAAMAYDPGTSQLLLFGGYDGSTYYADTWSWTGTTWSQLSPTTSPTLRAGASLAYDASSSQMVLFGGYNGSSYLQDTWTWSGTTWTALAPAAKPSAREESSFGYDTSTSQMLLFGGYNSGDLADTWSWTGTTWSALSPTISPSARYGAPIAYSPALGELALFGGQGATYEADTWVWTGTNWSQLSSSTYPSARVLAAMTYDLATSQMVLFGGYNGTSYLADTWQWSAVAVAAVSPIAGPAAGGSLVTITGIGFNGVTAVQFGGTNATSYSVTNSTQIVAVAPAKSVGTVDITVTNPANTSAISSADQFTYEAVPTVTSLSPTSGAFVGGTSVTITGTNLTGATAVDFGVLAATAYTVNSSTSITATSPAVAFATSVDVTVTTPVATSATSAADQFTYNPVPFVTGVSPNTGNTAGGTSVTITGTGLTGASAVKFGTVSAINYTVNSATSISVTSPAGSAGPVDVTVSVPGGTSATSSADQFTYEAVPTVTVVSPITALIAGGVTVAITGTNFTGVSGVMFGATAATNYTFNSATSITATAPGGSAGTVDITVTTPAGTSATSSADQFSYYTNPSWSQASPPTNPTARQGAAEAYDSGTGQTVLFGGGNAADTTDLTDTWAWNGTTWSELATGGPVAAQEDAMAYDPATSQLLLFEGWTTSGDIGDTWAWNSTTSTWTEVATTGPAARNGASMVYDLAASQLILFGGQNGTTRYNDTWKWTGSAWSQIDDAGDPGCTIACTSSPSGRYIPAAAYDPATTQVVLFGGNNGNYLNDTWTWNGTTWAQQSPVTSPVIRNGASMAYDPATNQLILFGGNNGSTYYNDTWYWTGSTWVQISDAGDAGCTITCTNSPNVRTVEPMVYDTATGQVVLFGGQTTSGAVLADTWLMGAPTVTALSPSSGLPAGGTTVVITGTSFTGAPATGAVMFGSTAATAYTVNSSTQITATSPAGTLGTVDVTVTTPDGTSTTSVLDQFTYQLAPTVTAVSPGAGLPAGGTAVTIAGTGFTGATAIKFGAVSAPNPIVVSSSEIVVVSPAGPAGLVDVTATTSSGTSATSPADQFTYESPPSLTRISPPTGTPSGGTSVTITGTGFTAASGVKFGSIAASSYTVNSSTQITAVSPAEAAATVDLTVTTPAGVSATSSADRFSFETVPTVTAVNPTTGLISGGTSVTIGGTGFSGATDHRLGCGDVRYHRGRELHHQFGHPDHRRLAGRGGRDGRHHRYDTRRHELDESRRPVQFHGHADGHRHQPACRTADGRHWRHDHRHLLHRRHCSVVRDHGGRRLHRQLGHTDHAQLPGRDRRHSRHHRRHARRHECYECRRQVHLRASPHRQCRQPDARVHDGGHLGHHHRNEFHRRHRCQFRRDGRDQLHRCFLHPGHRRLAGRIGRHRRHHRRHAERNQRQLWRRPVHL